MSEQPKEKLVERGSPAEAQPEKDDSSVSETHSQDADRHRRIKHPVSDK